MNIIVTLLHFSLFWLDTVYKWWISWLEHILFNICRIGPLPQHVAFIMDGNRRFAKKMKLGDKYQGHLFGFKKLEQVLQWCLKLDIRCLSVYAFSIENFQRPKEEIDFLMDTALAKFQLLSKDENIKKYKVRVQVHGRLDMIRSDVRSAAESVMNMTKSHGDYYLQILAPYTSREEIRGIISSLVNKNQVPLEKILDDQISTLNGMIPYCDMLVRTSGEYRLSDFFLWQATTHHCNIQFVDVLWPEFSFWKFFCIIIKYKIYRRMIAHK